MRWLFVLLVACGGPSATPDAAIDGPPGTIGPGGGSVSLEGGPTITVPPGALDHDVLISIVDTGMPQVYAFTPDGLQFAIPATVTFPLAKPPFDLAFYWSIPTGFERLAATTTATTMTAQVTRLAVGAVGPANAGFIAPTEQIAATGGTLDLSCLGMARNDAVSTQHDIMMHVSDWETDSNVAGAAITTFPGTAIDGLSLSTGHTDSSGNGPAFVSAGHKRVSFQIIATNAATTYTFDQPAAATTLTTHSMANAAFQVLPSIVGVTKSPTSSMLVSTVTDCQGHPLSNLIGTVSSTKGVAASLPGAVTYYFNAVNDLPLMHSSRRTTNTDGRFVVIELPAATTAYLQAWGLQGTELTLVAELAMPIPHTSAIIQSQTPAATTP